MNLDAPELIDTLDPTRIIDAIRALPQHINCAWEAGIKADLPAYADVSRIIIGATGTAHQAALLLAEYLSPDCPIPIQVVDDFLLPAWAGNDKTLLIISGHDGNEDELEHQFASGVKQGCRMLALAQGGRLIELAREHNIPSLVFLHPGSARIAAGTHFFLLLALMQKMGLTDRREQAIPSLLEGLERIREQNDINIPVVKNPAKRLAGQFLNRLVVLFGSGSMKTVAAHWKSQINLNAKAWAQVENIPEITHATLAGICQPGDQLSQTMTLFLQSPFDHPINQVISEEARKTFMVEGFNTDFYQAPGKTALECMWNTMFFGDFVSYYLALAYGVDPLPTPGLDEIRINLPRI